jgi:GNAT superfamily N-acetyltransferase
MITDMLNGGTIEQIELEALCSWHKAASQSGTPGFDWKLEEIGDALCSVSCREPSILVNRCLGLGSRSTPTLDQLLEIRQCYRDAGVSRFFLHVMPQFMGSGMENLLTRAGFRRYRGWMKFTRGPQKVDPAPTELRVRQTGISETASFAAIAGPAFDLAPSSQPAIQALANDPDWYLYMTYDDKRPAGTGAVYIRGELAYTDWGATHSDFRRRGSQTAILNARIQKALDAGCKTIVTMTGEAVPGDPQHSYSNILKRGFSEAYLRENWIPAES